MTLGTYIEVFFTIAILSVAFKENPVYRFAENAYVGLFAGYTVLVNWFNYGQPTILSIAREGTWSYVIPILLGLLIYARYVPPISWISRYHMAFMTGMGAGYVLTKTFKPMFVSQLADTIRPLSGVSTPTAINNLIAGIGVIATLMYFLFTVERKGFSRSLGTLGRWYMMIAFGAAFGNTVMTRFARLLGRMQFLLGDWLHLITNL